MTEQTVIRERIEALGYEPMTTGGGCMAWHLPLSGGRYSLLTDIDGLGLEFASSGDPCIAGIYDTEGEMLRSFGAEGDLPIGYFLVSQEEQMGVA